MYLQGLATAGHKYTWLAFESCSYFIGQILSAPLDRRENCVHWGHPSHSEVYFYFRRRSLIPFSLAVPTTHHLSGGESRLHRNQEGPHSWRLCSGCHLSFQPEYMLSERCLAPLSPVSQALPRCEYTHTHTRPRGQRAGCEVPACSAFTFPQSQPGFRAVGLGARISLPSKQPGAAATSSPQQFPWCQETE